MPLVTLPTTWPRCAGDASMAAQATISCVTTAINPTSSIAPSSVIRSGAKAAAVNASTESSSWITTSFLRFTQSPSGTRTISPMA